MKLQWVDYSRWVLKLVLLFFIFKETGVAVSMFVIWIFIKNEINYFAEKADDLLEELKKKHGAEDKTREPI